MDNKKIPDWFKEIYLKTEDCDKATVILTELSGEPYLLVASAENTNDMREWFFKNSELLEAEMLKSGYEWMYIVEETKDVKPFIYLIASDNFNAENVEDFYIEFKEKTGDERKYHFFACAEYKCLDIDAYDHAELDILEEELLIAAHDVFNVKN